MYALTRLTDEVADGVTILHLCLALWVIVIFIILLIFHLPQLLALEWGELLLLRRRGPGHGPRRQLPDWRVDPPRPRPALHLHRRNTTSLTQLRRRSPRTKTQ
jgi:hypothetical protein